MLRLLYRSYGGENHKGRPAFYSKLLSLASFLRAAESAGAEVVFLNDGPIPAQRLDLMRGRGEVVALPGGPVGMRTSYATALELPMHRGWDDEDVAYFSEDDYLHHVDAFSQLQRAADDIPAAGYFALYGSTPSYPAYSSGESFVPPRGWRPRADVNVDRRRWVNIPSTASTFGARVGVVRADLGIFKQGMLPYRTRYLDHETCLVYQGHRPFSPTDVLCGPADTRSGFGLRGIAVNAALAPFRFAFNARALTRRRSPHLLYASEPNLACHLETAFMAPGVDWEEQAVDTRAWAAARGIEIAPGLATES